MSQRTRSRMTAAAARKRPPATQTGVSASPSPRKERGLRGEVPSPNAVGAGHVPPAESPGVTSSSASTSSASSAGHSPSASASPSSDPVGAGHVPPAARENLPVTPQTLARTLRAVAAELERDPALARRVASAIAGNTTDATAPTHDTPPAAATADQPNTAPADSASHGQPRRRTPRTFTPSIVTGVSPDLGPGIPDPFALARRLGPDGLRAALAELRRGTLRAMIREYGIAPAAQVAHITDDARLRELILAATLK